MTRATSIVAYTISDQAFGDFSVLETANAWWLDQAKVANLILSYKYDSTDEEACINAGISMYQLRYFKQRHSEFSQVKAACKLIPVMRARKHIVANVGRDLQTARWYLERKIPAKFGQKSAPAGININFAQKVAEDREKYRPR